MKNKILIKDYSKEILFNRFVEQVEINKKYKKRVLEDINNFKNPYPKDIFLWDNKEKLDFDRGRFNRHCFEIVENIREELREVIQNE